MIFTGRGREVRERREKRKRKEKKARKKEGTKRETRNMHDVKVVCARTTTYSMT